MAVANGRRPEGSARERHVALLRRRVQLRWWLGTYDGQQKGASSHQARADRTTGVPCCA